MCGLASEGAIQGFVDTFALPFPNTVSEDGSLWARFGVVAQGEWIFVSRDGTARTVPYDLDQVHLEEEVGKLLSG